MRWVAWLLLAFAIAVGLSLLVRFNYGNVAILWPPYRIEVSANFAMALLLLGFIVVHLLLVATGKALAMPQRVRDYRSRRRHEKATRALGNSVVAFFEGRLSRVEKHAKAAQSVPTTAAAAALVAARSAQRMQEHERRDRWLADANTDADASNAVLMTQAEIAVDEQRPLDAIRIVERMQASGARHLSGMRTLLRAYEQAERWDDVLATLRLLEKRDAVHPAAAARLRGRAFAELLGRRAGDAGAIRELWRGLRADERGLPELAAPTVLALAAAGATPEARKIAEQALDAAYTEPMMLAYASLSEVPARDRLERIEGWRNRYGDEPQLLLALGRTCIAEKLWGKAEDYLRRVIRAEPTPAAHAALADLYESTGRSHEAALEYRAAAKLATA
jgi:HemY protein